NALEVNRASITFGPTGTEAGQPRCGKAGSDVNGDGHLDLVCHFDNQAAGFDQNHSSGVIMGETLSGKRFEGRGWLKVISSKQR
ncbi:MAG TPA: hypothetical protein VFZ81_04625, partial [Burkholderiales bacterium]